ncbi:MAG: hypothetical protein MJZ43_03990 [Bacteroidaceae bacterium]|nr:hypothetical protein [Bacteroidaceae bacterium]
MTKEKQQQDSHRPPPGREEKAAFKGAFHTLSDFTITPIHILSSRFVCATKLRIISDTALREARKMPLFRPVPLTEAISANQQIRK